MEEIKDGGREYSERRLDEYLRFQHRKTSRDFDVDRPHS